MKKAIDSTKDPTVLKKPKKDMMHSGYDAALDSLKSEHTDGFLLIVDDIVSNIFVLKLMLEKLKIRYETASNGEEAYNKVVSKGRNRNFTMILMDINMPVMDGIEASKKILMANKDGKIPLIPIIALSAQGEESIINDAKSAGIIEFIEKPITMYKLDGLIKRYEWNICFSD